MHPIPLHWVESLFSRMAIRYGAVWLNHWQGIDLDAVKLDWSNELAGLSNEALKYGVVNLPLDKPPTLGQFKAVCLRSPVGVQRMLTDDVKADPERVRQLTEKAKLATAIKRKSANRLQWAYDLQEREKNGEHLNQVQSQMWRDALRTPAVALGDFKCIDPTCLPPAMRPREEHFV